MDNELICNKFINQYLLRGRKFVENACFRYGYYNAQISGKIGNGFVDDFQYFVFTKSIKSLGSIRELPVIRYELFVFQKLQVTIFQMVYVPPAPLL